MFWRAKEIVIYSFSFIIVCCPHSPIGWCSPGTTVDTREISKESSTGVWHSRMSRQELYLVHPFGKKNKMSSEVDALKKMNSWFLGEDDMIVIWTSLYMAVNTNTIKEVMSFVVQIIRYTNVFLVLLTKKQYHKVTQTGKYLARLPSLF